MSPSQDRPVTPAQMEALKAINEVERQVGDNDRHLTDHPAQATFFDRASVFLVSGLSAIGGVASLGLNLIQDKPAVPLPVAFGAAALGAIGMTLASRTPRTQERAQRLRNDNIRRRLNEAAQDVRDGSVYPKTAEIWAKDIRVERGANTNSNDGVMEKAFYKPDVNIPSLRSWRDQRR
jgi:hypothetical protein